MRATVVGSGPNGLAAAIVLAQAGCGVNVLESQTYIGGGARSLELRLPGFLHDHCSAIHPLAAGSPFFRYLPLHLFGLEWLHSKYPLAHPLDDGTAVVLHRSVEATAAALGDDGRTYAHLMRPLVEHWEALADEFLQPLTHLPSHPLLLARFGMLALRSAAGLASRCFRSEAARALVAGLAAHSAIPLESPASAAVALVLGMFGHAVGWPLPRGGAQRISMALAAHLRALGGTIETGREVTSLESFPPDPVLLDLTAWQAARLLGNRIPSRLQRKLASFPHGPSVFKIDYALSRPIPWKAEACREAATIHLGGTFHEIATAERDVANGRVPERPFVILAQPTICDSTRAPAGGHVAWAYGHVPRSSGVDMTAAIEGQIERFAPGFRGCVLARHVTRPSDFQDANANLEGGDITGGVGDLWHMLARPVAGPNPYRLGRTNLYLCSSSTPPGGGVHGMCGYHAARRALAAGGLG